MRIARQFGISQSDVRKALATEGRDRKSGRWRGQVKPWALLRPRPRSGRRLSCHLPAAPPQRPEHSSRCGLDHRRDLVRALIPKAGLTPATDQAH